MWLLNQASHFENVPCFVGFTHRKTRGECMTCEYYHKLEHIYIINVKEGRVLTSFFKLKNRRFVCFLFPKRDSHKYKMPLKHLRKLL